MTDTGWEPTRHHPTNAEVREIIAIIIANIDATPDWKAQNKAIAPVKLAAPDETFFTPAAGKA